MSISQSTIDEVRAVRESMEWDRERQKNIHKELSGTIIELMKDISPEQRLYIFNRLKCEYCDKCGNLGGFHRCNP